jgi:hypothetical protein
MIGALEVSLMMEKILAKLVHVSPNDMPGFLKEEIVKTIWARSLIIRKIKNGPIKFPQRRREDTENQGYYASEPNLED